MSILLELQHNKGTVSSVLGKVVVAGKKALLTYANRFLDATKKSTQKRVEKLLKKISR